MTVGAFFVGKTGKSVFATAVLQPTMWARAVEYARVRTAARELGVADIDGKRSRVAGFIPTGWYPTAARVMSDGRLIVLNGKGGGSYANPNGPNPTRLRTPFSAGDSCRRLRASIWPGARRHGRRREFDLVDQPQLDSGDANLAGERRGG